MDNWLRKSIIEEFYWIITAITFLYYYLYYEDYKGLASLIRIALIFIGITAVLSIVASFINPLYARLITGSAATGFLETEEGIFFLKIGAGTYSFGQSLICLFPILIFYYKIDYPIFNSKKVLLFYIILLYFTIIRMQFFANILLATLSILIALLGTKRINISILLVILIVFILFIIPKDFYSNFLLSASNLFDKDSENYLKIRDTAYYITEDDLSQSSTKGRLERYPLLFDAFSKSPFLGNSASPNPDEIMLGYHLHWMGKLAATGILGMILFLLPNLYFIKSCLARFSKTYSFFAMISFLSFFALGFIKTISGRDIWFTYLLLIPGMYYLPSVNKYASKHKTP